MTHKIRCAVTQLDGAHLFRDEDMPFMPGKKDILFLPANETSKLRDFSVVDRIWSPRNKEVVVVRCEEGDGDHLTPDCALDRTPGWIRAKNWSGLLDAPFRASR